MEDSAFLIHKTLPSTESFAWCLILFTLYILALDASVSRLEYQKFAGAAMTCIPANGDLASDREGLRKDAEGMLLEGHKQARVPLETLNDPKTELHQVQGKPILFSKSFGEPPHDPWAVCRGMYAGQRSRFCWRRF